MNLFSRDAEFLDRVVLRDSVGALTVDDAGTVAFATPVVESILGIERDDLVGRQLADLEVIDLAVDDLRTIARSEPTIEQPLDPIVESEHGTLPVTATEYDGTRYYTVTFPRTTTHSPGGTYLEARRLIESLSAHRPEPLLIVDVDRRSVVVGNRQASSLFDEPDEGLRTSAPSDLCASDGGGFVSFLSEVVESGDRRTDEFVPRTGETTRGRMPVVASPCVIGGRTLVVVEWRTSETGRATRERGTRPVAVACERIAGMEGTEELPERCLDVIAETLGYDVACIRLFDADGEEFGVAASTPAATRLVETNPGFRLGASRAGRAYRTGEPVASWDCGDSAVDDVLTSSIHVPLGEQGVLTVASTDGEGLAEADVTALRTLAGTITAALAPASGTTENGPGTLNTRSTTGPGIDPVVQELSSDLVSVDSRDELESLVCSRLVTADVCEGVWMAKPDLPGERMTVTQCTGIAESTASALTEAVDPDDPAQLRHGTGIEDRLDDHRDPAVLLPLQGSDRVFGVLGLRIANDATVNSERLDLLADVISITLSSIEKRRLLLSDEAIRLEFRVTDPDCLTVALSKELGTYCEMKRTVRNTDGDYLSYVRVADATADDVLDAAESLDAVLGCRIISEHENECAVEVIREQSGSEVMMKHGATMHTAEADDGQGTLVIEVPKSADVRAITRAYQSYNPGSELVSKQEVSRQVKTAGELRDTVEQYLTRKQRSALSAAYHSGYYEWPRESTAEDVAASMGITASTLHQHLRHGHQKLLTTLFEG